MTHKEIKKEIKETEKRIAYCNREYKKAEKKYYKFVSLMKQKKTEFRIWGEILSHADMAAFGALLKKNNERLAELKTML